MEVLELYSTLTRITAFSKSLCMAGVWVR